MGGFCTTTTQPLPDYSEVVTDTQLPAWVSEGGKRLFEEASSLARSPFPQYTDARIASYNGSKLTPEEQQAANLLSQGATSYQSYIDDATKMASGLGQGFDRTSRADLIGDPYQGMSRGDLMGSYQGATREELQGDPFSIEQAQPYLDIYQGAQDSAVNEVQRQTELANVQNRATAARSGAFGGSRLGIQEALTSGEGARTQGDLRSRAAQQGLEFASSQNERDRAARFGAENLMRGQFDQDRQARFGAEDVMRGQYEQDRAARFGAEDAARSGFETEEASRLRATEALQGFAPLTQGLRDQAASGLFTAGQARRQLDQQALDMAYADYVEQRNYPQSQINYALGVLQGTPYDTRNISLTQGQQFIQSPSIYGQTLGGLGALGSAYFMSKGK
mgnify:CR=1 FL=1|tara:strand:- start:177 stop:1352 length:1176 start_codon:yes stop_codon:yes gene_type:complete